MKTIAGMIAVLMLAACGGSEPVATEYDPYTERPGCPPNKEPRLAFGTVDCCEPGAERIFPVGTVIEPGTPECGANLVICGETWTWRLVGSEWVSESSIPACR